MHKKIIHSHTHKNNEQLKSYVKEKFPKKQYVYKIRPRKPGEIFIGEILFAIFLIFMLIMLYLNYESNLKYQNENKPKTENKSEVDINIEVHNQKNFDSKTIINEVFEINELLFYKL
ncbi:MAG: hypothetical protein QXE31_02265 [Candidatus Woesearchaeota archaeon]